MAPAEPTTPHLWCQALGAFDLANLKEESSLFVLDEAGTIVHHIAWYRPGNPARLMEMFQALGLEV